MVVMNGKRARVARLVLAMGAAISLSACAQLSKPLFGTTEPELVTMTSQNLALRSLPAPKSRVRVAVYGFPDLTGQYKERDNVQTLSRAVTQGGSAMLIKALQDAGERRWFTVLDRSGLQDLIRERQIVSEMRRLYRGESNMDPRVLGPLKHAGVILEGGIVGYDTNIQTGGFGARYLGIGADTKWQMDTVTVSLRAVSTESGEVLASVTAQKAIASSALQGNIFRYVALDKLLEMETGITANEPKYVAVQQAIDKAVVGLVIEGSELGIWSFADRKAGRNLIARYRAEKYGNAMPATASRVVPPETRHPARVVEVRPKQRQRTIIRRLKPASTTPAPPPVQTGETLG
jgi:curli production assembly/transport component CsgG